MAAMQGGVLTAIRQRRSVVTVHLADVGRYSGPAVVGARPCVLLYPFSQMTPGDCYIVTNE